LCRCCNVTIMSVPFSCSLGMPKSDSNCLVLQKQWCSKLFCSIVMSTGCTTFVMRQFYHKASRCVPFTFYIHPVIIIFITLKCLMKCVIGKLILGLFHCLGIHPWGISCEILCVFEFGSLPTLYHKLIFSHSGLNVKRVRMRNGCVRLRIESTCGLLCMVINLQGW
jgi:hypothetical protein